MRMHAKSLLVEEYKKIQTHFFPYLRFTYFRHVTMWNSI